MKKLFLIIGLIIIARIGFAQTDTLHVYGPGGPLTAINECAKLFTLKTGIPVKVIGGPQPKWLNQAKQNADVIYGGAEYMLSEFIQLHPGMIDATTRTELYQRAAAILVRPGNPKHIRKFKDLAGSGIHILDVNGAGQLGLWEDIAGKENLIAGIQENIAGTFANTALGIEAWKKDPKYDAWITYGSWQKNLTGITELIQLPANLRLYRGTPIALAQDSRHSEQGKQFVKFLKSPECHLVFQKLGWI